MNETAAAAATTPAKEKPIVGVTRRTNGRRRLNKEDIIKRLSLPADFNLPQEVIAKMSASPTFDGPLTRSAQRQSLVSMSAVSALSACRGHSSIIKSAH